MSQARARSRAEKDILDMASTMATVLCLVMSKCSIGSFKKSLFLAINTSRPGFYVTSYIKQHFNIFGKIVKEKIKILSMWCCAIFFAAEFAIARPIKTSLAPGRWDPRVKAALEELTVEHGKGSDHNDPRKPPLAVLPWDKVFMINDLGDAVFQSMVQRVQFKFDDEFWSIIPIGYGRRRTQAAYEQFVGHPQRAWERQPTYQQYRKFFVVGD